MDNKKKRKKTKSRTVNGVIEQGADVILHESVFNDNNGVSKDSLETSEDQGSQSQLTQQNGPLAKDKDRGPLNGTLEDEFSALRLSSSSQGPYPLITDELDSKSTSPPVTKADYESNESGPSQNNLVVPSLDPCASESLITSDVTGASESPMDSISVQLMELNISQSKSEPSDGDSSVVDKDNEDSGHSAESGSSDAIKNQGAAGDAEATGIMYTFATPAPDDGIDYVSYESEHQMPSIMKLIQKDLSEPYSIYTYRYFIHNWPKLCFLAMDRDRMIGAIVCKLDVHKQINKRGYIAMLAVDEHYRRRKIGSSLVLRSIRAMAAEDADEIVLETEITNKSALRLYENLGFVRDKRLFRYYLNGVDALRLKLWLK